MTTYQTKDGDMLDEVIHKIHGVIDKGMVEATLEANRGLANYGPVLPAGLTISIPDREKRTTVNTARNIWS